MKILDAHTHLSGSESGETTEGIVSCLDACDVDKAFVFAPLLDVHSWELTDEHLDDIRAHNDYCADVCSRASERLFGFCVLNPSAGLAGGFFKDSVGLMIEEVQRCYHELGLRGVKMVPTQWYLNDPDRYLEQYLYPQRGLFEVAVTNGHIASEGSKDRKHLREQIFFENVLEHWQSAVREPQQPRRAKRRIKTPRAKTGRGHESGRHG